MDRWNIVNPLYIGVGAKYSPRAMLPREQAKRDSPKLLYLKSRA
jgi:hypothetical protein